MKSIPSTVARSGTSSCAAPHMTTTGLTGSGFARARCRAGSVAGEESLCQALGP